MCVCMCLLVRTQTHTLHVDNSDVRSGVGTRHLEIRKNPDQPKPSVHICCTCAQITLVTMYAGLRDELTESRITTFLLLTYIFFLKRDVEDVKAIPRPRI